MTVPPVLPHTGDGPTLVEFLLARIAEDEEAAKAAIELREPYTRGGFTWYYNWAIHTEHVSGGWGTGFVDGAPTPDRVMAECQAKRRIIEYCEYSIDPDDDACYAPETYGMMAATGEGVLERLALPYADHPDYRPEWSP